MSEILNSSKNKNLNKLILIFWQNEKSYSYFLT